MSTTSRSRPNGRDIKYKRIHIFALLIVINCATAIDYGAGRDKVFPPFNFSDHVKPNVDWLAWTRAREFRKVPNVSKLQETTERLLHYGEYLNEIIRNRFGELVYDYYDDYGTNQIEALYQIYRDTLERRWDVYSIAPNMLKEWYGVPSKICTYIHQNTNTCLKNTAKQCVNMTIHNQYRQESEVAKKERRKVRKLYNSKVMKKYYPNGFSLKKVLKYLRNGELSPTPLMLSGLLYHVHYDNYDSKVIIAERTVMEALLMAQRLGLWLRRWALSKSEINKLPGQTISEVMKHYLATVVEKLRTIRHIVEPTIYLSKHLGRDVNSVNKNIQLLGSVYDNSTINVKYLFGLILPNDTIDQDVREARDYLVHQLTTDNIVNKYLGFDKYQYTEPDQVLLGILNELLKLRYSSDIATSLQLHAQFWHKNYMVTNMDDLLKLFDAYENLRYLRNYQELRKIINTIKKDLQNSKNFPIELLCTRPRECLRIGLEIVANCKIIDTETKTTILEFIKRTSSNRLPLKGDREMHFPDSCSEQESSPTSTSTVASTVAPSSPKKWPRPTTMTTTTTRRPVTSRTTKVLKKKSTERPRTTVDLMDEDLWEVYDDEYMNISDDDNDDSPEEDRKFRPTTLDSLTKVITTKRPFTKMTTTQRRLIKVITAKKPEKTNTTKSSTTVRTMRKPSTTMRTTRKRLTTVKTTRKPSTTVRMMRISRTTVTTTERPQTTTKQLRKMTTTTKRPRTTTTQIICTGWGCTVTDNINSVMVGSDEDCESCEKSTEINLKSLKKKPSTPEPSTKEPRPTTSTLARSMTKQPVTASKILTSKNTTTRICNNTDPHYHRHLQRLHKVRLIDTGGKSSTQYKALEVRETLGENKRNENMNLNVNEGSSIIQQKDNTKRESEKEKPKRTNDILNSIRDAFLKTEPRGSLKKNSTENIKNRILPGYGYHVLPDKDIFQDDPNHQYTTRPPRQRARRNQILPGYGFHVLPGKDIFQDDPNHQYTTRPPRQRARRKIDKRVLEQETNSLGNGNSQIKDESRKSLSYSPLRTNHRIRTWGYRNDVAINKRKRNRKKNKRISESQTDFLENSTEHAGSQERDEYRRFFKYSPTRYSDRVSTWGAGNVVSVDDRDVNEVPSTHESGLHNGKVNLERKTKKYFRTTGSQKLEERISGEQTGSFEDDNKKGGSSQRRVEYRRFIKYAPNRHHHHVSTWGIKNKVKVDRHSPKIPTDDESGLYRTLVEQEMKEYMKDTGRRAAKLAKSSKTNVNDGRVSGEQKGDNERGSSQKNVTTRRLLFGYSPFVHNHLVSTAGLKNRVFVNAKNPIDFKLQLQRKPIIEEVIVEEHRK